jgi:hypothetical protein
MQRDFVKIEVKHKGLFGASSNYNHQFMHCVVWGNKIMKIKNYIFLSEPDFYNPSETVYSFFSINNKINRDIVDIISGLGINNMQGIVEHSAKEITRLSKLFTISESRNDSAYLYRVSDIAKLLGSHLYTRRRLCNTFQKKYPHLFAQEISINKDMLQSEVFNVFVHWMNAKFNTPYNYFLEEMAVKRLIDNHKFLDFKLYGIYDGATLIAFITSNIQGKCAYIDFVKADLHYRGINEYLFNFMAQSLSDLGVNTINFEEDAGILGLRKMKMLWKPYSIMTSYNILFQRS